MKNTAELIESISSIAIFATIVLAIAGTAYQVFSPNSALVTWVSQLWKFNPPTLIVMGGAVLLVKRWLSGLQDGRIADLMFYGVIMLGLYYGFNLLIGG